MASKSIFIAFIGSGIDQGEGISNIADGYECWNLKKFDLDGFISAIQNRIPPINTNVLMSPALDKMFSPFQTSNSARPPGAFCCPAMLPELFWTGTLNTFSF